MLWSISVQTEFLQVSIEARKSAPFPRTNRQASSLVPLYGVSAARFSSLSLADFLTTNNDVLELIL